MSSAQAIDWLVLTAASRAQARGFRAELASRQHTGPFKHIRNHLVVPDPGNRRAGSGGSTFVVLHALAQRLHAARQRIRPHPPPQTLADLFTGQRIIIIHSGGDSRRLPPYAAQGKVFLPLPCDVFEEETARRREAAFFDLILRDLLGLALPESGRVLIATGDVLLGIGSQQPSLDAPGVVGVAWRSDASRGSRHGVYVADERGTVLDFLQKPDEQSARRRGAIDDHGRALIDLGILSLDPQSVGRWLHAAGARLSSRHGPTAGKGLLAALRLRRSPPIDLFVHVLMAMAPRIDLESYLRAVAPTPADSRCASLLAALRASLHGMPFHVSTVPCSDFLHIGTIRELLSILPADPRVNRAPAKCCCIYNSLARSTVASRGTAIIEACDVNRPFTLGGDNVVVGLPALPSRHRINLPPGWGLVCLPIGARDWSVILFGADDDCKAPLAAGGSLAGVPLDRLLHTWTLPASRVWPRGADGTLWSAHLWTVGPLGTVLARTLWMPGGKPPVSWLKARRFSMARIFARVNHARLMAHREDLQRRSRLARLPQHLADDPWLPVRHIAQDLRSPSESRAALRAIQVQTRTADPLRRARLHQLAAFIRQRPAHTRRLQTPPRSVLDPKALKAVSEAVAAQITFPQYPNPAAINVHQRILVTAPTRIDFAGGWSDTPPICTELGGAVLNAAITLDGRHPISAAARLLPWPVIRITSIDENRSLVLRSTAAVLKRVDPGGKDAWTSLPRAALVLAGIAPSDRAVPLAHWLKTLGGGVELVMSSAIPKGSGLGTSSILGAAVLAALGRLVGLHPTPDILIRSTSMLEQMMGTAGGWQDQAGGIIPGIKLLTTSPGADQVPMASAIALPDPARAELQARSLLYYTGLQRLAANILHGVVARYLERDPGMLNIIASLKACAHDASQALTHGDIDAFAAQVATYWDLKRRIDPGSSTQSIEAVIRRIAPFAGACSLAGAGGGGFLYIIARDAAATDRVRHTLSRHPPNPRARFHGFDIDTRGLTVAVESENRKA